MLAGHLDEIGFIVTKIDNEGFIKFQPIAAGGAAHAIAKVTLQRIKDKKYEALLDLKPPHVLEAEERKRLLILKTCLLILARSREDAS